MVLTTDESWAIGEVEPCCPTLDSRMYNLGHNPMYNMSFIYNFKCVKRNQSQEKPKS